MPTWMVYTLLIAFIVAMDTVLISVLVRGLVSGRWNPIAEQHPAFSPDQHAETRRFQSFRMGLFNLGWCVHVSADERALHLVPIKPFRWLGMKPMSVPWESIELKPPGWRKSWRSARIRSATSFGHELDGPAWCLERADTHRSDVV